MMTQIVPQHAGYFWELAPEDQQWKLRWEPVKGYYSPPLLDNTLAFTHMEVPDHLKHLIGLIIGRDGHYFKYITQWSGCAYIFYRQDLDKIEIWGWPRNIDYAIFLFSQHFNDINQKFK